MSRRVDKHLMSKEAAYDDKEDWDEAWQEEVSGGSEELQEDVIG